MAVPVVVKNSERTGGIKGEHRGTTPYIHILHISTREFMLALTAGEASGLPYVLYILTGTRLRRTPTVAS